MKRRPSKTRIVGYEVQGDLQGTNAERVLSEAIARGAITQYDVGRQFTWFNGPPGEAMRKVRREMDKIAEKAINEARTRR